MHVGGETSPATLGAAGEGAHHDIHAAGTRIHQLSADGAHPAPQQVALDRTTHGAGDDEPEPGRLALGPLETVVDGQRGCRTPASAHDGPEVLGLDHPVHASQHRRGLCRETLRR